VNYLGNNKGVALVTSLMLTLLTLSISMVMLYMVLQSTQISGAHKRYKNSLDAAVGGVDIVTMEALPALLGATANFIGTSSATYFKDSLIASMPGLDSGSLVMVNNQCLNAKLTKKNWNADCAVVNTTANPREAPDMTFTLQSQIAGSGTVSGYRVYTKIISTTPGSTDMSGRFLEGQSTTGAPTADVGSPYLYRIDVSSEKVVNPLEKANLSVLYAY
jgi:hypothetical protein